MPEDERVFVVVREWITKAENDLKTAAHTLRRGEARRAVRLARRVRRAMRRLLPKAVLRRQQRRSKP